MMNVIRRGVLAGRWPIWPHSRIRQAWWSVVPAPAPTQLSDRARLQPIALPSPEIRCEGLTDIPKKPRLPGRLTAHWPIVVMLFAVAASTIMKLARLNDRELELDESRSAFFATLSFHDLIRYCLGDTAPPLYHLLLWCWGRMHLIASAAANLQMFSVLLSVLGAIGMFILARTWLGTAKSGAFAALLFAFSPILFVYSSEVRQYMLLVCCTIALLIVHHRLAVESNTAWGILFLYILLAVLLFYCHYVGLFILIGLLLDWFVATRQRAQSLAPLCFVVLFVSLAAAPWIPVMVHQHHLMRGVLSDLAAARTDPTSIAFGAPAPLTTLPEKVGIVLRRITAVVGLFPTGFREFTALLAAPLVAAFIGCVLLMIRGDRICRMVAWVFLLTGLGLLGLGVNATRYLMPLIPLLLLAVARVVQSWSKNKRWGTAGLFAGSLILCIYIAGFIRQSFVIYANPWRGLIATLQPSYKDGDIVVFDALYGQVPFDTAAKEVGLKVRADGLPETIYRWWDEQPAKVWGGPVLRQSDVDATTQRAVASTSTKTVWLVLYEVIYYDPRDRFLAQFSQLGNATEVYRTAPDKSDDLPGTISLRLVRLSLRSGQAPKTIPNAAP